MKYYLEAVKITVFAGVSVCQDNSNLMIYCYFRKNKLPEEISVCVKENKLLINMLLLKQEYVNSGSKNSI